MKRLLIPLLIGSAGLLPAQRPAPAAPPASRPTSAPAPSYTQLKYPPLKPIRIPNVATYTLPNGLRLYLLEDHELPLVRGTALVRAGNLFDPPDKVGLATMTGMVLRTGGTHGKTGDQLDVELEDIAASVESGVGETSGSVSFSTLKEHTAEVLGIFHDLLTNPQFRPDKVELARTQLRSGISRRNDSPQGILQREFASLLYGRDTPYGWRMEYATVDKIQRDDLLAFYHRYFFPANILLAVYGDFSTADMKARLEKLFGGWNHQQPQVPPFPAVRRTPAPGIYLAVKNDVTQTFFALGQLGGELRDPDEPALEVMADILGGGFQSRLVQRVRTRLGYAYSISADWAANYDHPGIFQVSGSTKSATTTETIQAVREEIERIRSSEVTEQELKTAKETALNSLVFAFDSKSKTLNRLLIYEYYGYPKDFIQRYQKALAAVTRADVLKAARARLDAQAFTIVTVGKPQDFGRSLATLGEPVTSIDLTIPEPKPEAAPATAESLANGKALLGRVQQAVGGADKLAAVKDVTEVAVFQLDPKAGGMRVEQTDRWLAPTYFRQDSQMPMGRISAYSDGQGGWISTPQGAGPMGAAQLKQVKGDLFRLYFRLLLSDRIPGRTVNLAGDDTLDIRGEQGESARLVVDPKTYLPAQVIYRSVQVTGPPMPVTDTFDEFEEVNGVKVPRKITIVQGDRKFADITITGYKINTGLTVEELSKKP